MARRRVPQEGLGEGTTTLSPAQARYVTRVLRLGVGDELVLFDPSSSTEAVATLCSLDPAEVRVGPVSQVAAAAREVALVQALGKGDKLDAVVRDATELGVSRVVPVTTRRTVVQPGDRAQAKVERYRRVAVEAARQCGRAQAPRVDDICSLDEAITRLASSTIILLLPTCDVHLATVLDGVGPDASLAFVVGPEGGLDPAEIERAVAAGAVCATLGGFVLRTETVAAAVLGGLLLRR